MTVKPTIAAEAGVPHRARIRERTLADLQAALARLKSQGANLTISAVAREAGVTPALVHNRYPEVAEALRTLCGGALGPKHDRLRSSLASEQQTSRNLRSEVENLRQQVRALASVNEALRRELLLHSAVANGKVVPLGSHGAIGR